MDLRKLSFQDVLFLLAFVIALGLRLLNLGAAPLSDFEASWALQALEIAHGEPVTPGPQPGYLALTSLGFSLLGATNFFARLWPALAGSLLVLAVIVARRQLGQKAALILAFALAVDPGLVALSRLAGGPMMALGFTTLALALAFESRPAAAGISTGLALLSGPSIWLGLLGLAAAWGAARWFKFAWDAGEPHPASPATPFARLPAEILREGIFFAMGTLLIIGSRFFTFPAGLGAWAASLPEFLRAWVESSGIPAGRVLVALAVYQPLALLFAIVAVISLRKGRGWMAWFVAASVLAVLLPGRAVADVAWAVIPLWVLAASSLAAWLDEEAKSPIVWGQAGAWFVLFVLAWLTLAGLRLSVEDALRLRWFLILGIVALGTLSTVFVGLGWSWQKARAGVVLGWLAALGMYTLATTMSVSQVRPNSPQELWTPPPATASTAMLSHTLRDLALMYTGEENTLEIVSLIDSPALQWVLRDFSEVSFQASLGGAGALPPVVIAFPGSETAAWAASYRGQDFAWRHAPAWSGALPEDLINWLIFRNAPMQTDSVILWARLDIFPDSGNIEDGNQ